MEVQNHSAMRFLGVNSLASPTPRRGCKCDCFGRFWIAVVGEDKLILSMETFLVLKGIVMFLSLGIHFLPSHTLETVGQGNLDQTEFG